jgi:glycosyltransferase involved in cell wall biosynthesis
MKVSIIIPHYNQNEFLSEALQSCLQQTYKNIEIIIVDDGSIKDPGTEIPTYSYPNCNLIKLVRHGYNKGLSSARNTGIKASTGDYVLCLDADDKLPPDYIEQLSKIDADIVGCGYRTFGDYEIEWKSRGTITLEDLLDGNRTQCSALVKRKVYDKVLYDEKMKSGWEDWLLWMEAVAHGFSMVCTDKTYLLYRKHGDSMVSHNHENAEKNKVYIEKKVLKIIKQ